MRKIKKKLIVTIGAVSAGIMGIIGTSYYNASLSCLYGVPKSIEEGINFNQFFLKYDGTSKGQIVKDLLDIVVRNIELNLNNNTKLPDIYYEDKEQLGPEMELKQKLDRYEVDGKNVTIISDTKNTATDAISILRNKIELNHCYNVDFKYDDKTGLINEIHIKY